MTIKILGAILIILGCGGVGFWVAFTHRNEENSLRQFISVLDVMECELRYRLTPLPELCRHAAMSCGKPIKNTLLDLAKELDEQISPDVDSCMIAVLGKTKELPELTRNALKMLGPALGHYDLDGQLKGLALVRSECHRVLAAHTSNQDVRLHSYKILSICAGAAMAILFI